MGNGQAPTEKNQMPSSSVPWWKSGALVAYLASLIAAIMPLTTWIGEYLQKRTEINLNAQNINHSIQKDYMQWVLNEKTTDTQLELIFGLFAEMENQPAFKKWAEKELTATKKRKEQLEKRIEQLEAERKNKDLLIKQAQDKIAMLEQESTATNKQDVTERLKIEEENVLAAKKDLYEITTQAEKLREKVGDQNISEPKHPEIILSNFGEITEGMVISFQSKTKGVTTEFPLYNEKPTLGGTFGEKVGVIVSREELKVLEKYVTFRGYKWLKVENLSAAKKQVGWYSWENIRTSTVLIKPGGSK